MKNWTSAVATESNIALVSLAEYTELAMKENPGLPSSCDRNRRNRLKVQFFINRHTHEVVELG